MKVGDLVRFIPDSKSGTFYPGLHGESGISIPADSIGLILKVHRKNGLDEPGWRDEDIERFSEVINETR